MATLTGNDLKKKTRSSGYKTKRGDQRRDALLNATKEIITLGDISEISFVTIAKKAEIPLPSVYHYFKNLDDLIMMIVEKLGKELLENLKLVKNTNFHSSEERIHFLLDENIKFLNEHPIAQKVFYAPSLPDSAKAIDKKLMLEMSELFFWSVRSELKRDKEEFFVNQYWNKDEITGELTLVDYEVDPAITWLLDESTKELVESERTISLEESYTPNSPHPNLEEYVIDYYKIINSLNLFTGKGRIEGNIFMSGKEIKNLKIPKVSFLARGQCGPAKKKY